MPPVNNEMFNYLCHILDCVVLQPMTQQLMIDACSAVFADSAEHAPIVIG